MKHPSAHLPKWQGPQWSRKGSPRQRQVYPGPRDTDVVQSPSDCQQFWGVVPLFAISTRPYALAHFPAQQHKATNRSGKQVCKTCRAEWIKGRRRERGKKASLSLQINNNERKINDGFLKVIIFTVIPRAILRSLALLLPISHFYLGSTWFVRAKS